PSGDVTRATASVDGQADFLTAFGQAIQQMAGTITLADQRLAFDTHVTVSQGRNASLAGAVVLHPDQRQLDVAQLTVAFAQAPWRLATGGVMPSVGWSDEGVTISPLRLTSNTDQRLDVPRTWRRDGNLALRVPATHVFLEALA